MKNHFKKLCFIISLFSTMAFFGQTAGEGCKTTSKTMKGVYNGKNLFFQNQETNGIQKIFINNKEIAIKNNSKTFELSLVELKQGQAFELKIVYCEMAPVPYTILNPEVIK